MLLNASPQNVLCSIIFYGTCTCTSLCGRSYFSKTHKQFKQIERDVLAKHDQEYQFVNPFFCLSAKHLMNFSVPRSPMNYFLCYVFCIHVVNATFRILSDAYAPPLPCVQLCVRVAKRASSQARKPTTVWQILLSFTL